MRTVRGSNRNVRVWTRVTPPLDGINRMPVWRGDLYLLDLSITGQYTEYQL